MLEGLAALPGKRSVVEAGAADDSNRLPFLPVPHYKSGLSRTSSCGHNQSSKDVSEISLSGR